MAMLTHAVMLALTRSFQIDTSCVREHNPAKGET